MVSSLMRQTAEPGRFPFRIWDDYQFRRKGIKSRAQPGPILPPTPALPPVNIGAPSVSGLPMVGNTLTSSTGTWAPPTPTFAYQWLRDGIAVGTNSPTYLLAPTDVGALVWCRVTATNASGSTEVLSNQVGPIVALAAPVNTVLPDVTGSEIVGQPLDCTDGTWGGTTPITFTYQWVRRE